MIDDVTAASPPAADSVPTTMPLWLLAMVGSLVAAVALDDWLVAPSLLALVICVRLLHASDGPPTLVLAFLYQWTQVTVAFIYHDVTGRNVHNLGLVDHEPMVLLALAGLVAMASGIRLGMHLVRRERPREPVAAFSMPARVLLPVYLVASVSNGFLQQLAWSAGGLHQVITSLVFLRQAILFLLLRRCVQPKLRITQLMLLVGFETTLGLTGYFADFRDGFFLAAMAILEVFDRRSVRHWVTLLVVVAAAALLAVVWTGIKEEYRREQRQQSDAVSISARLDQVVALTERWVDDDTGENLRDVDKLCGRMWGMYVQARAYWRVPDVVPYQRGRILFAAVEHVLMPRLLYAEKRGLDDADNEAVRRYAGVQLPPGQRGTSVAFGYMAESYVDLGPILMFVPLFLYGLFMGVAYRGLFRSFVNREIGVALVTAIFWSALYMYERSWTKMLGTSVALLTVVGGAGLIVDRTIAVVLRRRLRPAPGGGAGAAP